MARELVWPPQLLSDWCQTVDLEPEPEFLVKDLIPTDAAVLISGNAKVSFKTWFAFQVALSVASGRTISLLEPTTQGPVLIIEEEGPRKQTRRRWGFLEQGNEMQLDNLPIHYSHRQGVEIDNPVWLAKLCDFITEHKIVLVILDTFAKVHAGDENSTRDVGKAMKCLDELRHANPGCSVIFIHHLRKTSKENDIEDIDQCIRGSSALAGFYDCHIAMRKERESQTHIDMFVRSSDDESKRFQVNWYITPEANKATLKMVELAPKELPGAVREECKNQLLSKEKYSITSLSKTWGFGKDRTLELANEFVKEGILEKIGSRYLFTG